MSDTDNTLPPGGRRPGPWDARPEEAAPAPAREAPRYSARHEAPQEDKGQHPVWAVVSTLLMAGFLWFLTGSWVVAGAVLFGLFVHEYGHVLAMNRLVRAALEDHDGARRQPVPLQQPRQRWPGR